MAGENNIQDIVKRLTGNTEEQQAKLNELRAQQVNIKSKMDSTLAGRNADNNVMITQYMTPEEKAAAQQKQDLYRQSNADFTNYKAQYDALQSQIDTGAVDRIDAARAKGAKFGANLLGEGLDRLGTDPEMQAMLARAKDLSMGLDSKEMQAAREQGLAGIQNTFQSQQRALLGSMASMGIKGGAAGANLRELALAGMQQRRGMEQDLLLKNMDLKRTGFEKYANAATSVKTFDIGQREKEIDIMQRAASGASQEEIAKITAENEIKAAEARAAAASSGGKK